MVKLLVENGADVNACDYCGYSVICTLAENLDDENGYDMLLYLLDKGADPKKMTNYGQSAVWLAERNRVGYHPHENDKIIKVLMEKTGYSLTMDPDYFEQNGGLPLDPSYYENK